MIAPITRDELASRPQPKASAVSASSRRRPRRAWSDSRPSWPVASLPIESTYLSIGLEPGVLESDNPIMSEISATEASKRFADLLDAVEHRGETFTVVRRGRVVATIAPARRGTGADLRRILAEHPPDEQWADDLRELRRFVGEATAADPWND